MHFLAAALATLALAGSSPDESNVAPCDKAIIGHGSADWRGESVVAGPVGVRRNPLRDMSLARGWYTTKMPILVEGREPETVTVSVPPRLRDRVFLIYGEVRDRDGNPSFSFRNTRGYGETEFQLCGNKPRTIWPGGVRVKGTAPVRLTVQVKGETNTFVLRLGRPEGHKLLAHSI
ncbi:MAG TPA: hypothetical protein VEW07_12780 [Solirubrobacterales bacterium]|nr:hypothetical protein [Solirubrobacterales bacterium]